MRKNDINVLDILREKIRETQKMTGDAHIFFDAKAVLDMIDEVEALNEENRHRRAEAAEVN